MRVNKLLTLLALVITISILSSLSVANAEIKLIPPPNWQPSPNNNSTTMVWFQNSTKSVFGIVGIDMDQFNTTSTLFPLFRVLLPLILPNANSFIAQFLADKGVLESTDQTTFGKSNYGYRYFVNLNISSLSNVLNSSATLVNNSAIPGMSPDTLVNNSAIPGMLSSGSDVPFKGMFILALKQGDFYGIFFLSPRENFDTKMNELKPTLDSIHLSNSTSLANSTNR